MRQKEVGRTIVIPCALTTRLYFNGIFFNFVHVVNVMQVFMQKPLSKAMKQRTKGHGKNRKETS